MFAQITLQPDQDVSVPSLSLSLFHFKKGTARNCGHPLAFSLNEYFGHVP
jgi:hypothetical protein